LHIFIFKKYFIVNMKKEYLYLIVVLVILLIAVIGWYYFSYTGMLRCGPCGCFGEECGGGGYTPRYYWLCPPTNVTKCAATNPGGCYKLTQMGTC
jgi:hypothetical protein